MVVFITSANWHITRLGYSGLKRESVLSAWKLDKIVRGLHENKTHLQNVNHCVSFVKHRALQNSFMKPELVLYINDSRNSAKISTVFKLRGFADLYIPCNKK